MSVESTGGHPPTAASPRRHGLGRGLDALLASSDPARDMGSGGPVLIEIDPSRVRPTPEPPRREFDAVSLSALAASIRLHGLLHPIVVEPDAHDYRLVAGERRLRAARPAGIGQIPAIPRPPAAPRRPRPPPGRRRAPAPRRAPGGHRPDPRHPATRVRVRPPRPGDGAQ